jgi:glycosyltransferase involved in cell wall biosynthesis
MTCKLWIDVEDLFEYARGNPRPSGIQRLAFEIYSAVSTLPNSNDFASFVRHDHTRTGFRIVPWEEIETLFYGMTNPKPAPIEPPLPPSSPEPPEPVLTTDSPPTPEPAIVESSAPQPDPTPHVSIWLRIARWLVARLPPALQPPAIQLLKTQRAAIMAWSVFFATIWRGVTYRLKKPFLRRPPLPDIAIPDDAASATPVEVAALVEHVVVTEPLPESTAPTFTFEPVDDFTVRSRRGDIMVVLGSPWSHDDYAKRIEEHRNRGLKFALLVYDLIPIRRPEWCDRGLVRIFRAWFDSVFPLCDIVFAISRSTANDVEAYMIERGITLPGPVVPIPIGTGFGGRQDRIVEPLPETASKLPEAGSYALIVSTIEARKNHLLLFRVWRRLLEEMPAEEVPTLVFAGRVGWLVDDLMRQIDNTNGLNGKLMVIRDPTDAELDILYRGCLFTLFPSFFEGWGLPVTESLALGKACITSNRTSLPEAGGHLTRQFDPDNLNDAYAVIRATIEDRAGLARWEAQIRREFKATPWSATRDAILAELGLAELCPGQPQTVATTDLRLTSAG